VNAAGNSGTVSNPAAAVVAGTGATVSSAPAGRHDWVVIAVASDHRDADRLIGAPPWVGPSTCTAPAFPGLPAFRPRGPLSGRAGRFGDRRRDVGGH